jgi:hypothetical protein
MSRSITRLILAAVALSGLLGAPDLAQAQIISPKNPYRSFNISGINYGSMQWERAHRRQTQPPAAPRSQRRR